MAAELLNTVSIVSLAYTAVTLVLSYLVALVIGRKVSWVDRLVLWWIVWDGLMHLTLVRDSLLSLVAHLFDNGTISEGNGYVQASLHHYCTGKRASNTIVH